MLVGYGLDINERVGCEGTPFPLGHVTAPLFPLVVFSYGWLVRRQRQRLRPYATCEAHRKKLGGSLFATWADLVDDIDDPVHAPQPRLEEAPLARPGSTSQQRSDTVSGASSTVAGL
jgi:hypothetical protein